MPVILRCDLPGCLQQADGIWRQDGRIVAPDGWWLMIRGAGPVIACCQAHIPGVVTPPKLDPEEFRA